MAYPLPSNVTSIEKPSASIVHVTPEIAKRWLGRNAVNRKLKGGKMARYARDMAAGRWQLTGEAIKFSHDGRLLDGQNRLNAVIESGQTVAMFVVRGLDDESQAVMDSGAARKTADNLHMAGYKNSVALASTVRNILRMQRGTSAWNYEPSSAEIQQWIDENPEISLVVGLAVSHSRSTDVKASTLGASAWLITETSGFAAAELFWRTAATKVGLRKNDPTLALTSAFAEARRQKRSYDLRAEISAIVRAYNAWVSGKSMAFIRFLVEGNPVALPPVSRQPVPTAIAR